MVMGRPPRDLTKPTVHAALRRYNQATDEMEEARLAVGYWSEERAQALLDLLADGFTLTTLAAFLGVTRQALSQAVRRYEDMLDERWDDVQTADAINSEMDDDTRRVITLSARKLERSQLHAQLSPEARARIQSGESSIIGELRAAGLVE
jgi:hypothetical protein